jgi:hypothetical protein
LVDLLVELLIVLDFALVLSQQLVYLEVVNVIHHVVRVLNELAEYTHVFVL